MRKRKKHKLTMSQKLVNLSEYSVSKLISAQIRLDERPRKIHRDAKSALRYLRDTVENILGQLEEAPFKK